MEAMGTGRKSAGEPLWNPEIFFALDPRGFVLQLDCDLHSSDIFVTCHCLLVQLSPCERDKPHTAFVASFSRHLRTCLL